MRVPLSAVNLSDLERRYARDALETGWISGTGEYIRRFEQALASRLGRKHVIAVCNGTAALELALLGLGMGPGDEVIVPALTFAAPAAAVCTIGARPVLADISSDTWTLDPDDVRRLITTRTRAILAVDVLGHPCNFDELSKLGLPLIEDAAEAHGAFYRDSLTGSMGQVSTFSFHANKAITTGEGGAVATDDDDLCMRMRLIANHGMSVERPYWHTVVGRNFRMTNVTAAIGLGQVERWEELIRGRDAVAKHYEHLLADTDISHQPAASWAKPACWLYTIAIESRELVLNKLRAAGVDARSVWPALADLPLYAESVRGEYAVARRVAQSALWLPTWADMPNADIVYVAETLISSIEEGTS